MTSPSRVALALAAAVLLAGCAVTTQYRVPLATDGFGLQFVPVRVNGVDGVFLVDSGASHTVVDLDFARKALGPLHDSDLRLAWLGSRNASTKTGVIEEIIIGPYRQRGPIEAHVLDLDPINRAPARKRTIRLDGILGSDFLISHGAFIDYQSRELGFQPVAPEYR